jgi:protein-tyrosine phosphatase
MVANADLVLTMTEAHRSEIQLLLPAALSRTFTLREFIRLSASAPARGLATAAHQAHHARPFISAGSGPEDIADPIGGPLSQFEQLAEELDHLTEAVAAQLSVDTQEND